MPGSTYPQHCILCKGNFRSKPDWLQHLTTDPHQLVARRKCVEILSGLGVGSKAKGRYLNIFSSFPMTGESEGAQKIIQYLSRGEDNCVTDFICWEERPCLAIIQLGSFEQVKRLLSRVQNLEFRIDDERVQIKLATNVRDLEWSAMLPPKSNLMASLVERQLCGIKRRLETLQLNGNQENVINNDVNKDDNENQERSRKKVKKDKPRIPLSRSEPNLAIANLNTYARKCGWSVPKYQFTFVENFVLLPSKKFWSCSVTINGREYKPPLLDFGNALKKKDAQKIAALFCEERLIEAANTVVDNSENSENEEEEVQEALEQILNSNDTDPCNNLTMEALSLECPMDKEESIQDQFQKACQSVKVPEDKYNSILELKRDLETLFRKTDPSIEVGLFSHFHLKLDFNRDEKRVFFFVYSNRPNSTFGELGDDIIQQVLSSTEGQRDFAILQALKSTKCQFQGELGLYHYKKRQITFMLTPYKQFIVEVQLCRLLEYMCTFNARCHSLISMVFYWCKINAVQFGDFDFGSINRHLSLPEPLTTEWLVIHFLCLKGIIPSVRDIQQRPHTQLPEPFMGIDIGFHADPKYAQEWKSMRKMENPNLPLQEDHTSKEFVLSVLTLFQGFLEFYGKTLADDKWILNTKDGEVYNVKHLWSDSTTSTKMTHGDFIGLRMHHRKSTATRNSEMEKETDEVALKYYKCNHRAQVKLKHCKILMVHPFVFTWTFSIWNSLPFVQKLMKESASNLEVFLSNKSRNDSNDCHATAESSLETLESLLKCSKHLDTTTQVGSWRLK